MQNYTYEISETVIKDKRYFHAFFINEDTGLKAAWLHGRYDEERGVPVFFIFDTDKGNSVAKEYAPDQEYTAVREFSDIQEISAIRSFIILDTLDHYGTDTYENGYAMRSMGAESTNVAQHHGTFQTYDWVNDKLPNLWLLESDAIFDISKLDVVSFQAIAQSFISPLTARQNMKANMAVSQFPFFEGRIILRDLHGNVFSYADEGQTTISRTNFIDTNMPVDDHGLLLHLTLFELQQSALTLGNKAPMAWSEKAQRIFYSVDATMRSVNFEYVDSKDAMIHEVDGESIMGIIEKTEDFPSQEFFRKIILDIVEKSSENYDYPKA